MLSCACRNGPGIFLGKKGRRGSRRDPTKLIEIQLHHIQLHYELYPDTTEQVTLPSSYHIGLHRRRIRSSVHWFHYIWYWLYSNLSSVVWLWLDVISLSLLKLFQQVGVVFAHWPSHFCDLLFRYLDSACSSVTQTLSTRWRSPISINYSTSTPLRNTPNSSTRASSVRSLSRTGPTSINPTGMRPMSEFPYSQSGLTLTRWVWPRTDGWRFSFMIILKQASISCKYARICEQLPFQLDSGSVVN